MRTRVLVVVSLMTACFVPTADQPDASTAAGGQRCLHQLGSDELVCVTIPPVVCGGVTCAADQVCCQTTGACVAAGSAACPKLPSTWRSDPAGPRACGSAADCASDEFCMIDSEQAGTGPYPHQRCIGSAHCQPMTNCGSCGPAGSDRCRVCGCDGVTYESIQAACVAGVTAPSSLSGACGAPPSGPDGGAFTVACGTSAQCPAGAACCFRTGKCFDPATEPWRCEVLDSGVMLDCASDGECNSGAGGGSGSEPPSRFCAAQGCGGPGLCTFRASANDCGGAVQSVCGCDRQTYVNACWARAAGVRVASAGVCP